MSSTTVTVRDKNLFGVHIWPDERHREIIFIKQYLTIYQICNICILKYFTSSKIFSTIKYFIVITPWNFLTLLTDTRSYIYILIPEALQPN